ncbi:MAG: hypothetical protein IIV05_01615 [Ruminococcus sp.]|nr:hypothetical protein [Ruminococcus sp.]
MREENGKIVEITEGELFCLYIDRGFDDIMSFPDYMARFKQAGCCVIGGDCT